MKVETAIKRIVENQRISDESKRSKLFCLACKIMPGSIAQGKVIQAWENLKSETKGGSDATGNKQ